MCAEVSVCLWRVSSENSSVELDFLKALSSQRWIECKICEALWKIAGEKEEGVKKNRRLAGWQVGVEEISSYITKSVGNTVKQHAVDLFMSKCLHHICLMHTFNLRTDQRSKGYQDL